MKEYTNRDSQRPQGCVALDGGHTWPFFSTPIAWDILVAEDATRRKASKGVCYKMVTIIFQCGTNMLQIAPLSLLLNTRIIPDGNLLLVVCNQGRGIEDKRTTVRCKSSGWMDLNKDFLSWSNLTRRKDEMEFKQCKTP
jgi:hypothetical protein